MKTNQAFTILSNAGDVHRARIILKARPAPSRICVWHWARMLRNNVPVAKIIHQKWFYGLKFYTNKHTLDPRPDTETLVSAVLNDVSNDCAPDILDIGTGTGCVIISILYNLHSANGIGIDISHKATLVAQKNARIILDGDRLKIKHGDFRKQNMTAKKFDIIVSNPPYIATNDARVNPDALHDPKIALYAGTDGLDAYRAIAKNAKQWIKSGGKIYLEIGIGKSRAVRKIFQDANWNFVRSEKDLSGILRVLVFSD